MPLMSLLLVLGAITLGSAELCLKLCDNADPSSLANPRTAGTGQLHGSKYSLVIDDNLNAGYAQIEKGTPGDEIWIDRTWHGGSKWDGNLGKTRLLANTNSVKTRVFNVDESFEKKAVGSIRACISAHNHPEVACTHWIKAKICGKVCDDDNAQHLKSPRTMSTRLLHGRTFSTMVSDEENVGFGRIINGKPGDPIWIDRSFDGGKSWDGHLGERVIPENSNEVNTLVYNFDGPLKGQNGVMRACGSAHGLEGITCTDWHRITPPSDPTVWLCNKICDNEVADHLKQTRTMSTRLLHGRTFSTVISDKENVGFGRIINGKPGDSIWIDRSWDGGKTWEGHLGGRSIPENSNEVTTLVFNIDGRVKGQVGIIRACGSAKDLEGITCTDWHRITPPSDPTIWTCNKICDHEIADHVREPRTISTNILHGRKFSTVVSDKDNTAFGRITNGKPGDYIWLDRSWDDGKTWAGHLGGRQIPDNSDEVSTLVFNIDGNVKGQIGVVRACGSAKDLEGITCTTWHRVKSYKDKTTNTFICSDRDICDNENPESLVHLKSETFSTTERFGLSIALDVFRTEQVGYATIRNGKDNDKVWIERSWDGGRSGDSVNTYTIIPENRHSPLYNIDNGDKSGSIRACGKAVNHDDVFCTSWYRSDLICDIICDNENSTSLKTVHIDSTKEIFGRQISLLVSDEDKAGFARIINGESGDSFWIDRRWNGEASKYNGNSLGYAVLERDTQYMDTSAFNFVGNLENSQIQSIRACGQVRNRNKIACTAWYSAKNQTHEGEDGMICIHVCDKSNSGSLADHRLVHIVEVKGRKISVIVSDNDNAGYASITDGEPGDKIWIDRSWNAGQTWNSHLGDSLIHDNAKSISTPAFSIDGNLEMRQIGVIRACGTPVNTEEEGCTPWTRASVHSGSPAEAAATTLMMYYNDKGLWDTTEWWTAASCLTAIIDYMKVTRDRKYLYAIEKTFERNKNEFEGNFCNDYMDDTGWWGLAWVSAYDLTGNQKYLDTAKTAADYMYSFSDSKCGGGVYWSNARNFKNAVTNGLFIKLTAALHNRISGDVKYLNRSLDAVDWFAMSGMVNEKNLVNDGLNDNCQNYGKTTWTHNQGLLIGGFVELYKATQDTSYLDRAKKIADAVVKSSSLSPSGTLHEPCSEDDCYEDAYSFKGVFARNLGELNYVLDDRPYQDYISRNAKTIFEHRNSIDQYGFLYEGPWGDHSAATQHSALDMLTAARR